MVFRSAQPWVRPKWLICVEIQYGSLNKRLRPLKGPLETLYSGSTVVGMALSY